MSREFFELLPFESSPISVYFTFNGVVERSNDRLSVDYSVIGPIDRVLIQPPAMVPGRKDHLWEETCFECFIGTDLDTRYWEINLSPAGHWNIYQFNAYRSGMEEVSAGKVLPSIMESATECFFNHFDVDLNAIGLADARIRIGVCAILQTTHSNLMHWAIVHPGSKPDFHRQDSFVLNL